MFDKDPLKPEITANQILGLFLYLFLVAISVWATGESLTRTFDLDRFASYFLGLGMALIAAAMLNIIKDGFIEKVGLKIFVGVSVFLVVWLLSLLTNTHSFFVRSSLQDLRMDEINSVLNANYLIESKTSEVFESSGDLFKTHVNNLVNSLTKQITMQHNPGLGPEAQKIIEEIQLILEQPITPIAPDGTRKTFSSNLDLADGYSMYILNELLEPKLSAFNREKHRVLSQLSNNAETALFEDLSSLRDSGADLDNKNAENLLSRGYSEYSKKFDYVRSRFSSPLLGKLATYSLTELPNKPLSLELKKISSLPKFVRSTGGYNQPNFIWAFLLALGVDLGAFATFYYMVLPRKRTF